MDSWYLSESVVASAEGAPEGLGESAPRTGRKEVHLFHVALRNSRQVVPLEGPPASSSRAGSLDSQKRHRESDGG